MSWRNYLFLFLIGTLVVLVVSFFQKAPGYMDADYYFAGGMRVAQGYGFSEPYLWNYLDDPAGIPHPSHAYWMPFASMIAAAGMFIARADNFNAAKLGFIMITGLVPVFTAALCYSITNRKEQALLAGILASIPGFYLSYMGTTDVFGVYMLLGAAWFLLVGDTRLDGTYAQAVLLGLVSGLMHLARADGFMWLLLSLLALIFFAPLAKAGLWRKLSWRSDFRKCLSLVTLCIAGYLLVMGPWMVRNYVVYGALIAPGGTRSLWLTNYDELYAYPATMLTPARWLSSGIGSIASARIQALGQNLQTVLAVQGEIFMAPLTVLGLWYYRRDVRIRLCVAGWLLTFLAMTFIFPFVGWRGGFFHSGSAIQPLLWAVVPTGLARFIQWGARVRNWNAGQANIVFRVALVFLALMLTVFTVSKRVIGDDVRNPAWGKSESSYQALEKQLQLLGARPDEIVMVNNAPGYYVASGREALSIPSGGLSPIMQVAHRYGGKYLLLEKTQGLAELYDFPTGHPDLEYLTTSAGVRIFRLSP